MCHHCQIVRYVAKMAKCDQIRKGKDKEKEFVRPCPNWGDQI